MMMKITYSKKMPHLNTVEKANPKGTHCQGVDTIAAGTGDQRDATSYPRL